MRWSYGLTTVPSRLETYLPKTLVSLKEAGFSEPRLFVDGGDPEKYARIFGPRGINPLEMTLRTPTIRTFGNWILGLAELYIREPAADRYAMFQDDFVTYKNLRQYLEGCIYPETGYWNLYTMPSNRGLVPRDLTVRREEKLGWYESNQMGRGAVALVFSLKAVQTLLLHAHIVERPTDVHRGHKSIDGGIVTAFRKADWTEWVHHPSLVQHIGAETSMGAVDPGHMSQPNAPAFMGEGWDAMQLISS